MASTDERGLDLPPRRNLSLLPLARAHPAVAAQPTAKTAAADAALLAGPALIVLLITTLVTRIVLVNLLPLFT